MFYFLSKTLYILAMPVTWLVALLAFALATKSQKKRRNSVVATLVLLLLSSNPVLQNVLMQAWEIPAQPLTDYTGNYQTAIVLGGITEGFRQPTDRVYTHKGADRVLHAALLYQKGIVERILVTGSFYKLSGESASEAEAMKQLLMQSGVPESAIMKEERSRNTRENAMYSKQTLQDHGLSLDRCVLVTSAFHMRRALGCFEKEGIKTRAFSTDFYSSSSSPSFTDFIFPSEEALYYNYRLCRELLGYLVYKLLGYA